MYQDCYHHANSKVSQISADFNEQLELSNNAVLSVIYSIPSLTSSSSDSDHIQEPPTHHMNSAAKDVVQLEVLKLLNKIELDMKQSAQTFIPSTPTTLNFTRRQHRKTPDNQTHPPRINPTKHFWTHGDWYHTGKEFRRKEPGHKQDAALNNRMRGCNEYFS